MKHFQEEDAVQIPESGDPIHIQYTLKSDDIYRALKTSRIFRKNFVKAVIETVILSGLTVLFGVWWILWDDGNAMIFCIACGILIGLVWAMVLFSIRSNCNKFVTGEEVRMIIWPDLIEVNDRWTIPLDGSVICEERNNVLVLYTGETEWTLIPLQSIKEPEAVKSRILQRTKRTK